MGLDLSLRCPAAVAIPSGWVVGDWPALKVESWPNDPPEPTTGAPEGLWRAKYERLEWLSEEICRFSAIIDLVAVFVESYAFSRFSSSVTKLAELGGVVRVDMLRRNGIVLQPVTASSARKYLLGSNPKGAKKMVEAQLARYGASFKNDDECDAFAVANYGLSELGVTALSLA